MLNDPYNGGTDLPYVTVITPAFDAAGQAVLFYVGSRGHHANISDITPGSMPPDSTVVEEEGVLINNFKLVSSGRFLEAETVAQLSSGDYPARNISQNLADIAGPGCGQPEGCRRIAQDGRALRYGGGAGVHEPRLGQCGRSGAARDHCA